MSQFHGFYYTGKDEKLQGLKLSKAQLLTMGKIAKGSFQMLSYEKYWKHIARYMITHAPQGYIAYNGTTNWVIGNCGCIFDKTLTQDKHNGVNVVQFCKDKSISYQWYVEPLKDDGDLDPIYDLVFTPWDWLLEGEGDDEMFELDKHQKSELDSIMGWTGEMHAEMEKKWPSEKYFQ
jgi:hypothetical protein